MANTDAAFGLLPLGIQNNATPSFQLSRVTVPNTTGVGARGDGLQKLATGYMSPVAAAGVTALNWSGIIWGFEYLNASLGRRIVTQYWPGSGATGDVEILYVPLGSSWPSVRIVAQATGTPFTRAMIGANMDITYVAPSSVKRGGSSLVSIAATDAGAATLPWRFVDFYSSIAAPGQPGTDDTSNYNWGIFEFNNGATDDV